MNFTDQTVQSVPPILTSKAQLALERLLKAERSWPKTPCSCGHASAGYKGIGREIEETNRKEGDDKAVFILLKALYLIGPR